MAVGIGVGAGVGFGAGVGPEVAVRVEEGEEVRVAVGVRVGVYVGVAGVRVLPRLGALADLAGVLADVIGSSWPVGRGAPDCRMTNHPTPAINTNADRDASSGPATP
ncbi:MULTISPECIES: hypothetical protein [Kribbella]|uniref:hypothetical protein n=1 Tax=Kribbella TaxID=182639 RepID=UPI002F727107